MPIVTTTDENRSFPASETAAEANQVIEGLQHQLVETLEEVARRHGDDEGFSPIDWLRDQGRHGGGRRYATADSSVFNRASINVSVVHYDDMPDKRLASATALSTIIHPANPQAPSMHMHISWTELRDGKGYWRLMADLNPSIAYDEDRRRFEDALKEVTGELFEVGKKNGERYFYIPALERHRGVAHFYLEGFDSGDFDGDRKLARKFGQAVIETYAAIVDEALSQRPEPGESERRAQLDYHTVYFFQVLTLDRGTTSGILVHDQNDVGILASLPSQVDRKLLASWQDRMESPQDELLSRLVDTLPDQSPTPVTDEVRAQLAQVVRKHYKSHPEALALQARGDIVPPTVQNHE